MDKGNDENIITNMLRKILLWSDDLYEQFKSNWLAIPQSKKKEITKIRTAKQIETIDKAIKSDDLRSMISLLNYARIGIKTMECCFKIVMHYKPDAFFFLVFK